MENYKLYVSLIPVQASGAVTKIGVAKLPDENLWGVFRRAGQRSKDERGTLFLSL